MIACVVITSFLGCLVTVPLFFRYAYFLDLTAAKRIGLFFVALLLGCLPLLSDFSLEPVLGKAYPAWRATVWFLYVFCIILLTFTVLRDVVWAVLYKAGVAVSLFEKQWVIRLNAVTAVLALAASFSAMHSGLKIPEVKTVSIASDKIQEPQDVVLLSDLHIHRTISPAKIKGIVERANALNPDVILLDGDILDDDVEKIKPITELLKGLKAKKGIFFVTGNHEFYVGYKETVAALKAAGFTFLENSGESVGGGLYVAGVPDVSGKRYGLDVNAEKAFEKASDSDFKLLMSHTPADFKAVDLTVSGHTHGGQIFPFHVFVKLANKYLAGGYDGVYVTRGAGQWGPQMRFLAPSEITFIKLSPKGQKAMNITPVFPIGEPNPYGKFFTGKTYLTFLNVYDETFKTSLGNVTFEPAARTNWHKHTGGQILLVTAGEGRYQERGKPVQKLNAGDVVRIAPNVEHWHGAAPNSWFSHIAVETNPDINVNTWLEPVSDAEYK